MAFWPFPSGYPAVLDNFLVSQVDGLDVVWANHPNSLASAIMTLQAKLNIDNGQVQNTGGLAFDPVGHVANPAPAGVPSVWIDTTTAPGYTLMYTDELGVNYDLGYAPPTLTAGDGIDISALVVSAMVQHAGNPNGVLACSKLGYHVLDTTTNSYYYCSKTGIAGVAEFTLIGPHKYGADEVWVDTSNGDDAEGDGSPENPYKTLAHACAQVPSPTNVIEFMTPVVFHLAPGQYDESAASLNIPQRFHVVLSLNEAMVFKADIAWKIDPQLWFDYGLSLSTEFPRLSIVSGNLRREPTTYFPSLSAGRITVSNGNPGTGNPMPDKHVLTISGVSRNSHIIHNQASGTLVQSDAPLTMALYLKDSPGDTDSVGGSADYDAAGPWIEANEVEIYAENSSVQMAGTCRIVEMVNCAYLADRTIDVEGNPYSYGRIHGMPGRTNIVRGHQVKKHGSLFGIDLTAVPPHGDAAAITFDRESLSQMAGTTDSLSFSFNGFVGGSSAAWGRGWFFDESGNSGREAALKIPCDNGQYGSWRLFSHAYEYGQYQHPNNKVLAADNRHTICLEPGRYWFEGDLALQYNYVDVLGFGDVAGVPIPKQPGVEFYLDQYELTWGANDASFHNVKITNTGDGTDRFCLRMDSQASLCSFKNLSFHDDGTGGVLAVVVGTAPGSPVRGAWEDCWTALEGFLYGGDLSLLAVRCYGGRFSFGGWNGAVPKDLTVGGRYMDCRGGDYSFAATRVGGTVVLSGTFMRCEVSGYGFASTRGGAGSWTADCQAVMTDCDNKLVGGGYSFGHSQHGEGKASGKFYRCNSSSRSFGSSSANAVGVYGIFGIGAEAVDCEAGDYSFGSNEANPAQSTFAGRAERCVGRTRSFGSRGEFTGKARQCRANRGSFGDQMSHTKSELIECEVTDIAAGANEGPPGVFGALVRRCLFAVRAGQAVAPLWVNGGTVGAGTESRVFDCDLFEDVHGACIDGTGGGGWDIQMAHCRSRSNLGAGVSNILLAGTSFNTVDAMYDPT